MNTSTSNSHTSTSGSCTQTVDYTETGDPLYNKLFFERRLRELVEAGNIEAIKLALALRPQTYEVTC